MAEIEALIRGDKLIVEIPAEYLENAFEMGVTTNVTGKVSDRMQMLHHFAIKIESGDNDSDFGRFIDKVCADAIEDGELFVSPDEDE